MMTLLHLTFLWAVFNVLCSDRVLEFSSSAQTKEIKSIAAPPAALNTIEAASNILYQSKDGGLTWEDVSYNLPEPQQPESFYAGESALYLQVKDVLYRSKSNLQTPVWEKVDGLDPRNNTIAFSRSGVVAFGEDGIVYQNKSSADSWVPVYTNFKKRSMRTVFETASGTVFLGCENGLYKSADKGRTWKQVQHEGGVMNMVEADGVLLGTGVKGIMRSTDQGEHWEWVVSEGGVGIAVERIKGGFAAITYNSTTQSRRIRISLDAGQTWQAIDAGLQPSKIISSIKQVGNYLLCSHPDGIFRSSDQGKTWTMVHGGVENNKFILASTWNSVPLNDQRKVFMLFVSGNVVYAVARDGGC